MPDFHYWTIDEHKLLLARLVILESNQRQLEQLMATIQEAMAAMRLEVTEAKGAAASSRALIEGFAARVAALAEQAAAGQAVADELAALSTELSTSTDALVAAVVANPLPEDGGGSGPVVTP